jgi:conjugal transfer pilus assembly protein TraA
MNAVRKFVTNNQNKVSMLLVAAASLAAVGAAHAGSGGTEFAAAYTLIEGWITGVLGKLMAIGALAVGLGIGIMKQSIVSVVVGLAMALAVFYGPTVISGIVTAVL